MKLALHGIDAKHIDINICQLIFELIKFKVKSLRKVVFIGLCIVIFACFASPVNAECSIVGQWTRTGGIQGTHNYYADGSATYGNEPGFPGWVGTGTWVSNGGGSFTVYWNYGYDELLRWIGYTNPPDYPNYINYDTMAGDCNSYTGVDNLGASFGGIRSVMPPIATFTFSPTTPTIIHTVTFSPDIVDNTNRYTYLWQSSDGATSSERQFSYQFTKIGKYTVSLTVTDKFNSALTDTKGQEIVIMCGGSNPVSAVINRGTNLDNFGCRIKPFTSESGESINICWPQDRFIMIYNGPLCGSGKDVGRCEFTFGSNFATVTYVDNNNNGEPDCFLSTYWRNKDYGEDDNNNGLIDWNIFNYNVNNCELTPTHQLFQYPYPCGGGILPRCVVWDQATWNNACKYKSLINPDPICDRKYIYSKPEGHLVP